MKKFLLAGLVVSIMSAGAFAVYAGPVDIKEMPSERGYGNVMATSTERGQEIDFNSPGTEEEAKAWRAHFDEMDKFHEENRFEGGYCHNLGGSGRNGRGMMGRNR